MWCTEGQSVDFIKVDFHKGSPRLSGLPAHKNTTNGPLKLHPLP